MNLIAIIAIIILAYILDFLIKKYVKLSMVLITIILVALIIVVDSCLFMAIFVSEISVKLPIILKLIIIIISILPIICIKEYISHTIRILDFCINKNKMLEMGYIEKGIIQEIKLIEIHRNDLVFRIELLQLSRNHPFVGFLHQSLNRASSGRGVELLG